MIGNGFDLEHDLPTKYIDFLEFVKKFQVEYKFAKAATSKSYRFKEAYFERIFKIEEFENRANALHSFVNNNVWIDYFQKVYEHHLANKENWIDFEKEISDVVQNMDSLIKYYEKVRMGQDKNDNVENCYRNRLNKFVKDCELDMGIIGSNISKMLNDLNRLISALEIYIWDYVGNQKIKYYNPDIEKIYPDKVFSFNYSDTYRRLYAYNKKYVEYSFVHGFATNNIQEFYGIKDVSDELKKIYVQMSLEKNNMVLGIDEYLNGENKSKEIDFIAFKKYYQRIYKKTGNEYKKWLQQIDESVKSGRKEENVLYIFGHSLDETDGDILKEFITHDNLKTVIYYRNKEQLGQQIANLVKILKSDELIERVYGSKSSITFEKQSPREEIEGSSFEITSDIMRLNCAYRLNSLEVKSILNKIKVKIEQEDLNYFYSQKSVITLVDVMQKNGLTKLYENKLLKIAYELMNCNGLREPEQFIDENWAYQDYDNSFGCSLITSKFIKSVNLYNRKHFNRSELEIFNFDEQLIEYEKLIKSKRKIDKKAYLEIMNKVFLMFYDKSSNIDELWNILLKISRGLGENVAEETLKELLESSEDELNIIRYNHLLYEIQMNEYFDMKVEEFKEQYEYEKDE